MSDSVEIPRVANKAHSTAPSWWSAVDPLDGSKAVLLRCGCGKHEWELDVVSHVGVLSKHLVAADGTVSPSIYFPVDKGGCGWHVTGRLLGWPP